MPEPSPAPRVVGLRDAVARDLFAPALQDLRVERLCRRQPASRLGGHWIDLRYAVAVAALYTSCVWRSMVARDDHWDAVGIACSASVTDRTHTMLAHFRHAVRLLIRQPLFATVAILTLALGIGANTAVFAVVEAVLLRPLPIADAERLVVLRHRDDRTGITKEFIAIGDYVDLAARQTQLETLSTFGHGSATLTPETGEPFLADALAAGPGLLEALKARPAVGRLLEPRDAAPGAAPVVVLGHHLWETRFGSDPNVVGRRVRVGQLDREIIGVADRAFRFPPTSDTEVILPQSVPAAAPAQRKAGWVFALGRVKPGVAPVDVAAEIDTLSVQLEREHPEQNLGSRYYVVSLRDELVGSTRRALLLMLGAVAVVLLIACANVGNLLLARALGRRQEMAVRVALGARRGQILVQLLAESCVVAIAGGMVGVAAAYWGVPALVALIPETVNAPGLRDVGLNAGVLAFTFGLAAATTILFAVITTAGTVASGPRGLTSGPTRITANRGARRAASALVVTEVALAVVLLTAAGLILRSSWQLLSVDLGFTPARVLTMTLTLPSASYPPASRAPFFDRLFETVRAVPAVEAVGVAAVTPLTGNNWTTPFERADRPVVAGVRPPDVGWQNASGGYFTSLRIPLVAGRLFTDQDRPGSPSVVIISESIAAKFFPGESAVGRRVRLPGGDAEIVGVVGDIRRASLTDQPREDLYLPFGRQPGAATTLFVRTTSDPLDATAAVTAALKRLEPRMLLGAPTSLERVAAASMADTTLALWLLGVFAAIALALAAIGVYGVMSYAVRQRTREIGVRMALGASQWDILRLVARQGGVISVGGLGLGVVLGLAASRSMSSMLFQVSASDPRTVAGVLGVLAVTLAVACYLPARRAARVDAARTLVQ